MESFDNILHWKLKQGSHTFPGKDGGTCINEAAIVAAGFPYQPVGTVEDMPACFSRPICRLALRMNDAATDDERRQLLPFVTRLACADTPEIEQEREAYVVSRMRYRFSFQNDLEVLEGALAIGRQADLLATEEARTRMDRVQQSAATETSVPDKSLFSTLGMWLTPMH